MGLQALKIVEQELQNYDRQTKGQYQGVLAHLLKRITDRIQEECIDIPGCDGCRSAFAEGAFWRKDSYCDLPRKENLCGDCVRALKEDGVGIEHYVENQKEIVLTEVIDDDSGQGVPSDYKED
jgi:hypothetical protein